MRRIGLDFDGVIANTDELKREWFEKHGILLNKLNKSDIFKELENQYSKEFIYHLYKGMSEYVFCKASMERISPINNAIKSIKNLSKQFEIYIISARNQEQIMLLQDWLSKYKIDTYIKEIISSSEEGKGKLQICKENNISFFCDDDIRHLICEGEYNIVKFLFNSKLCTVDDIYCIENWNDIVNYLERV